MTADPRPHRRPPARALLLAAALTALTVPSAASATASPATPAPQTRLLVSGLEGAVGSTVGPDGALYVAESAAGRIARVDPRTGRRTTLAGGLPRRVLDTGGAMDVAFLGRRAYVLVTLVGPEVGGGAVDGIYRVDGSGQVTVVADIGAWAVAHPPVPAYFVPTGVQYALQSYRGGFLVADGHHNRLLRVTLDGEVAELAAFPNVVPTGIATAGRSVYLAQAGPVPHEPGDGKVVRVDPRAGARSPEAGTPGIQVAPAPPPAGRPTSPRPESDGLASGCGHRRLTMRPVGAEGGHAGPSAYWPETRVAKRPWQRTTGLPSGSCSSSSAMTPGLRRTEGPVTRPERQDQSAPIFAPTRLELTCMKVAKAALWRVASRGVV